MRPSAPKAISSWIPQAQRGNKRKPAGHKGLWISMQSNYLSLVLCTNINSSSSFIPWWQELHDHIFSEPVHSFCLELIPDFQPTSEVMHLSFSFVKHASLYWPWSLPLFAEYSACPSS
jgi:hypothetical protein